MTSQLYMFDMTVPTEEENFFELKWPLFVEDFNEIAKKWVFQLERGEETGYVHVQARVSLHKKKRLNEFKSFKNFTKNKLFESAHVSPTSNNALDDDHYCGKLDTRILGPWRHDDDVVKECKPQYIPRQVREITEMRPFQKAIIKSLTVWDTRTINCVIQPPGKVGKSILISICRAYKYARVLPPVNDTKDLLRMVCDMPTSKAYLFDMPRAMNKDRLYQFYAAIETIKDGYAYDDRYHFTEKVFDCPNIWIFTNSKPDCNLLSKDRWVFWTVNPNNYELCPLGGQEVIDENIRFFENL